MNEMLVCERRDNLMSFIVEQICCNFINDWNELEQKVIRVKVMVRDLVQ